MVSIYFVILTPPVLLYPLTVQKKPFFKTVFQPAGKYVPGAWEICSSRLEHYYIPDQFYFKHSISLFVTYLIKKTDGNNRSVAGTTKKANKYFFLFFCQNIWN